MKSEKQKYMYWRNQGYSVKDMSSAEARWFENMEEKYGNKQHKDIKKQMKKTGKYIKKEKPKHKKSRFMTGKKGRNILDRIFLK